MIECLLLKKRFMASPGAYESHVWKQTVDGQWQAFKNLKGEGASTGEIYKASGYSQNKDGKCGDVGGEKLTKSAQVWTEKGYGTISELTKEEEKEVVKVKVGEEEEHTLKAEDVKRKIVLQVRMMNGHKFEWVGVTMGINSKVGELVNVISSAYNKSSFFITLYHNGKPLDKKATLAESKIQNNDNILVTLNSGTSKVYKRFRDISTSYWYVASSWDAIMFKCERPLIITGFGVYKQYYTDTYQVRYKVFKED